MDSSLRFAEFTLSEAEGFRMTSRYKYVAHPGGLSNLRLIIHFANIRPQLTQHDNCFRYKVVETAGGERIWAETESTLHRESELLHVLGGQ